jgi:hypothetical protein
MSKIKHMSGAPKSHLSKRLDPDLTRNNLKASVANVLDSQKQHVDETEAIIVVRKTKSGNITVDTTLTDLNDVRDLVAGLVTLVSAASEEVQPPPIEVEITPGKGKK